MSPDFNEWYNLIDEIWKSPKRQVEFAKYLKKLRRKLKETEKNTAWSYFILDISSVFNFIEDKNGVSPLKRLNTVSFDLLLDGLSEDGKLITSKYEVTDDEVYKVYKELAGQMYFFFKNDKFKFDSQSDSK